MTKLYYLGLRADAEESLDTPAPGGAGKFKKTTTRTFIALPHRQQSRALIGL